MLSFVKCFFCLCWVSHAILILAFVNVNIMLFDLQTLNHSVSLEKIPLDQGVLYFFNIWLEKTLMLGGIGGRRKKGWQRMRWLGGMTDSMDMSLSELSEMVMDSETWRSAIHGVSKSRTWLSDWTELNWI